MFGHFSWGPGSLPVHVHPEPWTPVSRGRVGQHIRKHIQVGMRSSFQLCLETQTTRNNMKQLVIPIPISPRRSLTYEVVGTVQSIHVFLLLRTGFADDSDWALGSWNPLCPDSPVHFMSCVPKDPPPSPARCIPVLPGVRPAAGGANLRFGVLSPMGHFRNVWDFFGILLLALVPRHKSASSSWKGLFVSGCV